MDVNWVIIMILSFVVLNWKEMIFYMFFFIWGMCGVRLECRNRIWISCGDIICVVCRL